MKAKIKKFVGRYVKRPIAMCFGYIFYKPKYLKGKYFGKDYGKGWTWVMRNWFM